MKNLIFITVLAFLFIVPSAYAINVTYVSHSNCLSEDPCSCYQTDKNIYDYSFCTRLEQNLGYTVYKIPENDVKDNSNIWQQMVSSSDTIFLGNVSDNVIYGADQTAFCNNINSYIVDETRRIFSTGKNNLVGYGCIFKLGFSTFSGSDNTCNGQNFVKLNDGFITNKLNVGSFNIIEDDLFVQPQKVYVHNIDQNGDNNPDGWIGSLCTPGTKPSGTYPVLNTGLPEGAGDKAIFWGLSDPAGYTQTAWDLFDRTFWFMTGEYTYGNITGVLATTSPKPGDILNVTFEQSSTDVNVMTSAKLTLIYPNGDKILNEIDMDKTDDIWNKSYSVEKSAPNGTYTVIVKAIAPGSIVEFTKKIDIIPYTLTLSTDKYSYTAGENINIGIKILNAYDPLLKINASINITDPSAKDTVIYNGNISYDFTQPCLISADSTGGTYTIKVGLTDSDKRTIYKEINFAVKTSGDLSVAPNVWEIQTSILGNATQVFTISNDGLTNITNLQLFTSGDLVISLDKNSISKIAVNSNTSFSATAIVTEVAQSGSIIINNSEIEYIIDASSLYTPTPVENSLIVSPKILSIVTIPGKTISSDFELENIAAVPASGFSYTITDMIKNIVTISMSSQIDAGGTKTLNIITNSANLEEGTYTGTITIASSVGNDSILVNVEVIGNIAEEATTKLAQLELLKANITKLQNKRKDVTELNALYDSIKTDLEDAKAKYEDESYEEAQSSFQRASSNIAQLESKITTMINTKADYSGVIWAFAIIIIISIIAIVAYKYKNKILELVNKVFRKKEESESGTFTQGDYRTEYY